MPLPVLYDGRNDFSGGLDIAVSPDKLNPNELVQATNARLDHTAIGAISKRAGTQRTHSSALFPNINYVAGGIYVWPGGDQVVVVGSDGSLWTAPLGSYPLTFTKQAVAGTLGSGGAGTGTVDFAEFRGATSGAPLLLFIAIAPTSGTTPSYYSWTGSVLTQQTGTNSAGFFTLIRSYQTRMFAVDTVNFPKALYWSRTGDATYWTVGLDTDGGESLVDVQSGNNIMRLEDVGSSMLLFTDRTIALLTGTDAEDMTISQDTAGVSSDVGIVHQYAAALVEQMVAFLATTGAYFASETGIQAYGQTVEPLLYEIYSETPTQAAVFVAYHRSRHEIWHLYQNVLNGGVLALVYNTRLQAWTGPFTFSWPNGVNILSISNAPSADPNAESTTLYALCSDGYVRDLDVADLGLDDVLANGSSGNSYGMIVEVAPSFFLSGPGVTKLLRRVNLQANLPSGANTVFQVSGDGTAYTPIAVTTPQTGLVVNIRLDMNIEAHRFTYSIADSGTGTPLQITGLIAEAWAYGRY